MHLKTKRLVLKILSSSDAAAYVTLSNNEGFRRFQISDYRCSSIDDAEQWIAKIAAYHQRNQLGIIGVFNKDTTELIGLCALKYIQDERHSPIEIMYRISSLHWGQGYGLEIGQALVPYAFENLKISSHVATVDTQNFPSKKILEKLGFQF